MAEDKKPKIDLKSRLQKMGGPAGAPTPMPPQAVPGGPPMAVPAAMRSGPAMPPMPPGSGGIPAPPMTGPRLGSTGMLDPSNPLAAAVQPSFRPSQPAPAHPAISKAQVIEMDEGTVEQARSTTRKRWVVITLIAGLVFMALGWMAGSANTVGAARKSGVQDAHDLATDILNAKKSLDDMKTAVTDGGKSIVADRKFPVDLQKKLTDMNVDFGGDKLVGRRFTAIPPTTATDLFDFITRVASLNDKKLLIVGLLSKLQKPVTEELARPAGQNPITLVVIVDKNTPDMGTYLAPLLAPIVPDEKTGIPDKFKFTNPRGGGNAELPRLTDVKIPPTGAAITVQPGTFDKACPSLVKGQETQLLSSMNSLIDDIQGQKATATGDAVVDDKPGLSDIAQRMADALAKVN
jgi:hypothetical protein